MDIRIIRVRKVYGDGRHNAFTGIASAFGETFICFRSGTNHVSRDGIIRVIASGDMETWRTAATVQQPGLDLRDPKVAVLDGKLMVFTGGSGDGRSRRMMAVSTDDGRTFGDPVPLSGLEEGQWLWHMRPCDGRLYGTAYKGCDAVLYDSADGIHWQRVSALPLPGNEVHIDFDGDGVLWALARCDANGCIPSICAAEPPYTHFHHAFRLPMRLQGPMIKRLDGGCVVVCRQWDVPGRHNVRTEVFWVADGCGPRFVRTLPSGGDTSYADWLDTGCGRAVISYYSAHEYKMNEPHDSDADTARNEAHAEHTTAADIYVADVSYATSAAAP